VVIPGHLEQRRLRLRTGGVEHKDINWTESFVHRVHELDDLPLVGDVRRKRDGDSAFALDSLDNRERLRVGVHAVDSHRKAVLG
jgi:hypothetical protein